MCHLLLSICVHIFRSAPVSNFPFIHELLNGLDNSSAWNHKVVARFVVIGTKNTSNFAKIPATEPNEMVVALEVR